MSTKKDDSEKAVRTTISFRPKRLEQLRRAANLTYRAEGHVSTLIEVILEEYFKKHRELGV